MPNENKEFNGQITKKNTCISLKKHFEIIEDKQDYKYSVEKKPR